MPNIKSAAKRMRTSKKSQERNKAMRSRVHSADRMVNEAIPAGDAEKTRKAFNNYFSALDRAAKAGVLKANTVSRRKSRATKAANYQASTTFSTIS